MFSALDCNPLFCSFNIWKNGYFLNIYQNWSVEERQERQGLQAFFVDQLHSLYDFICYTCQVWRSILSCNILFDNLVMLFEKNCSFLFFGWSWLLGQACIYVHTILMPNLEILPDALFPSPLFFIGMDLWFPLTKAYGTI